MRGLKVVDPPGLEPRTTEPKSAVLPLHHGSVPCLKKQGKGIKFIFLQTTKCKIYFLLFLSPSLPMIQYLFTSSLGHRSSSFCA